jgi:hypothetical protein
VQKIAFCSSFSLASWSAVSLVSALSSIVNFLPHQFYIVFAGNGRIFTIP